MGDFHSPLPRKLSDAAIRFLTTPREEKPTFGNIVGAGEEEARREQGLFFDFARTHDLGDLEDSDVGLPGRRRLRLRVGQNTVRGSQIDADDVFRISQGSNSSYSPISTSAGARIQSISLSGDFRGRSMRTTRHPR